VGCVLTLINQLDVFLGDKATAITFVKTGLNFQAYARFAARRERATCRRANAAHRFRRCDAGWRKAEYPDGGGLRAGAHPGRVKRRQA
jgi:hypothetical protein